VVSTYLGSSAFQAAFDILAGSYGTLLNTLYLNENTYFFYSEGRVVVISLHKGHAKGDIHRLVNKIRRYCRTVLEQECPIILIVDYAGDKLRWVLEEELGVHWIDLSGNGNVATPELTIKRVGIPNKYTFNRLLDNPTTPTAAKLLRYILTTQSPIHVRKAASDLGLDKGLVCRHLQALSAHGWLRRNKSRRRDGYRVVHPLNILEHWRERHIVCYGKPWEILQGRIDYPNVENISAVLQEEGYKYAWTGMAAVTAYTKWAGYHHLMMHMDSLPYEDLRDYLFMNEHSLDPNFWIVVNARDDTFDHIVTIADIKYVDPLRAYCDMKFCNDPYARGASTELRKYINRRIIRRR